MKKQNMKLVLGWLYPDLMSIYGDRGNIIVLQKRCEWRGIGVEVVSIDQTTKDQRLATCDLLMMGGAQDRQQTIVANDLLKKKNVLSQMIENEVPGLYICGGFQYLGKYYKEADGTVIKQLGILDVWTENPGGKRLIGNIAVEVSPVIANEMKQSYSSSDSEKFSLRSNNFILVGFENHGGRTRLGPSVQPLGKVIKGYGSNAEDHTEGAVYKNSIGTYLHGPILPKNPFLADWLIQKALEKKYSKSVILGNEVTQESNNNDIIVLSSLDDTLAQKAHDMIFKKMS